MSLTYSGVAKSTPRERQIALLDLGLAELGDRKDPWATERRRRWTEEREELAANGIFVIGGVKNKKINL